jgi:hypothetical protein
LISAITPAIAGDEAEVPPISPADGSDVADLVTHALGEDQSDTQIR